MNWLAAILTWWSADPQAIDTERPRAAACVMAGYASMAKQGGPDAEKDTDADTALGEPGAGLAAEAGRQQPIDSSGTRLLRQTPQGVAPGCANGKCVAVPRVRQSLRR